MVNILDLTISFFKGEFDKFVATEEFIETLFSIKTPTAIAFPIVITPSIATYILTKHNNCNRKINKGTCASYTQQIEKSNWLLNGETIVFFNNSNLGDGQHRLTSCVKSGDTIEVFICCGINFNTMPTIDSGKTRTAADALSILADDGFSPSVINTAIKRAIYTINGTYSEHGSASTRKTACTNNDVVDFYFDNREMLLTLRDSLNKWFKKQKNQSFIKKQEIGGFAIYFAIKGYKNELINEFFETLLGGRYGNTNLFNSLHTLLTKPFGNIERTNAMLKAMEYFNDGLTDKSVRRTNTTKKE